MNLKDIENWSDTKRLIVGLPLVVILLGAFGFWASDLSFQTPQESTAVIASQEKSEITNDDWDIREVYLKSHIASLLTFDDTGLMDFAVNLNETCPYYEPDGTTYRNCIFDLVKKEEGKLSSESIENLEGYKKYCSEGALEMADEGSHGYIDTYNTCLLYKLQAKANLSYEEVAERILADEPKAVNAEGTIIGNLTFARYVVLSDDQTSKLRGWIIEGPESEGVPPSNTQQVYTYPTKYKFKQRITFSGELKPGSSWCGEDAQIYVSEAGIQTTPFTNQQCLGWVDSSWVTLASEEFKCPKDFIFPEEYTKDLKRSVMEEPENPNLAVFELVERRFQEFVARNCKKS